MDRELASPALYRPKAGEAPRIDRFEMLRYLGHTDQPMGDELTARIEQIATDLEHSTVPRGVRRVFAVDATGRDARKEPCIRLAGTGVKLRGTDIFRHLKDARLCAVLVCTLGMDNERRLRALSSQDPLGAVLYDAASSAYIEAAIDAMERDLARVAAAQGMSINWRFSPGYGDCPLDAQPALVAALNATRLIGLTVTGQNLLLPTKSVTALIGLFDGEVGTAHDLPSCTTCRLHDACPFRKRGTTCHPAL